MKTIFSITILLLLNYTALFGKTITISGIVKSSDGSGELIGAQIYTKDRSKGTSTDAGGRFRIEVLPATTLYISYIGYVDAEYTAKDRDTSIVIRLLADTQVTDEVEVKAKSLNEHILTAQSGTYFLSSKQISQLPRFMGEADPIRAVAMSPGVSQTEGTQGYAVRGSGREQNLILLNSAPVFNPSHLLGLFSVFNADAVREVSLIKSGIPSQYGGRLSSVMLVETGPGRPTRIEGSGSVGLLASNIRFSAPIIKDRMWAGASVRQTYLRVMMDPMMKLTSNDEQKTQTSYKFTDIDASVEFKINTRNYLDACVYYGNDAFSFINNHNNLGNTVKWGNRVGSFRWRSIHSEHFSWTNTLTYSAYTFAFTADQSVYSMTTSSDVETIGYLSSAFCQFPASKTIVRWGIDTKKHQMKPSDIQADVGDAGIVFPQMQILHAIEPAAYIHADFSLGDRLLCSFGLRGEYFAHLGKYFQQIGPNENITDTIEYNAGETVYSYKNIQPRLSARYLLSEQTSVKASYSYTVQNIHLSSMSSSALPADIWYPASAGVRPMNAHQITTGYFVQYNEGEYLGSIELFGKKGEHIGELKEDFYQLYNTALLSQSAHYGDLYSFGTEISISREIGDITGSISATFSRSLMKIAGLNNGELYPSQYDKPIDGTAFVNYKVNDKWSISSMFVYTSGKTATMPVQRHIIQGHLVNIYSGRNQFRMPDYHRLDLSATRTFRSSGRLQSELVLSIYNVYSRLNPYYIYYETEGDVEKMKLQVTPKAVSFYPILPSIAWRFTF